jgi:hypothetical protein
VDVKTLRKELAQFEAKAKKAEDALAAISVAEAKALAAGRQKRTTLALQRDQAWQQVFDLRAAIAEAERTEPAGNATIIAEPVRGSAGIDT